MSTRSRRAVTAASAHSILASVVTAARRMDRARPRRVTVKLLEATSREAQTRAAPFLGFLALSILPFGTPRCV